MLINIETQVGEFPFFTLLLCVVNSFCCNSIIVVYPRDSDFHRVSAD